MSIKLNFKRIARETAIDFFAPLTAMYKLLRSDLSTARSGEPPRRASPFRQRPTPWRFSRSAQGQSPASCGDLQEASQNSSASSGPSSGPVV